MYHPPSKRKQLIRQVVVYTAMSVTIILAVTALVFIMLGYDFNKKDGRIEQGGLLQFITSPAGATVTIDGNMLGSLTPSKSTAFMGSHFIAIDKLGYKTWQKSVDVIPGSILWLNYARLIPTTLTPKSVADFTTVTSTASSPNNTWIAVKEDPATPEIRLVNVDDKNTPLTTLTLPAASYTSPELGKTQSFTFDTWDGSGRYLIVKHAYDDTKTEWLVVDRQDISKTKNITAVLGIDASKVLFHKTNSRILFVQIGADIRQVDLDADTLSRPLVTNVSEFSLSGSSTVVYVTHFDVDKKVRSIGYYQAGNDKPITLRSFTEDALPLHVSIGTYFNETYLAVTYGDSVDILKGVLPKNDIEIATLGTVASFKLAGGAQWLSISANGRFVTMQSAGIYTIYDLEINKMTTTTLKGSTVATKELPWIDDYTLMSDKDSVVRLYEFDGANQQDIMSVVPGFSVSLSPNGAYLYGISKTVSGIYQLQRVQLII